MPCLRRACAHAPSSHGRHDCAERKHRFEQQAKQLQGYRKLVSREAAKDAQIDGHTARRRRYYDELFKDSNNITRLKPVRRRCELRCCLRPCGAHRLGLELLVGGSCMRAACCY